MTSTSNSFFGLKPGTFATTPDPDYVFKPRPFRKVLSQIADGFRHGATTAIIIGEAGSGKTTLCRHLVKKLPSNIVASVNVNLLDSTLEVLASICNDLNIQYPENCDDETVLVNQLQEFLTSTRTQNKRTIILIDNAQNVGFDLYQHLDLLTQSDSGQETMHHFILTGPISLIEYLKLIGFKLESKKKVVQCKLGRMNKQDTIDYIHHRLAVGGASESMFTEAAESTIYRYARGVSRSINLICDRSLCIAHEDSESIVTPQIVKMAFGALSPPTLEESLIKRVLTAISETAEILANDTLGRIERVKRSLQFFISKGSQVAQPKHAPHIRAVSWGGTQTSQIMGQRFMAFNNSPANALDTKSTIEQFPTRNLDDKNESILSVYERALPTAGARNDFTAPIIEADDRDDVNPVLLNPESMILIPGSMLISAYGGAEITVQDFHLDQTPVTNEMYARFVEETNHAPPEHWWNQRPSRALLYHPVVGISYQEANRFAQWCGKRLPTSGEWEAAARRPEQRKFPWGDNWQVANCNCPESKLNTTVAVDSNPAGNSVDGCADLVGNVWEWTCAKQEQTDLESGYAWVFGGSYRHPCTTDGAISRSALLQMNRYAYVGFRCAKDVS